MPREQKKKLGVLLLEAGLITQEQLNLALEIQRQTGDRLGDILVQQGFITERQMFEVLEFQMGIPFVDLDRTVIDAQAIEKLPAQVARRYNVIPVRIDNNVLWLAMRDPLDIVAIDDIRMFINMNVYPMLAKAEAILRAIDRYYGSLNIERAIEEYEKEIAVTHETAMDTADSIPPTEIDAAPIIRLLNSIIEQAVTSRASDIHIEPMEEEIRIRFRIDGELRTHLILSKSFHAPLITRIKIMGNLDIAEKRLPQDGRIKLQVLSREIDMRISLMPTINGEKAVLRVLDKLNFIIPKSELGFTQKALASFDEILRCPHGMVLVTGPTGSGKSTTLYSMLRELNSVNRNIITIEDPVEYIMQGINQIQVNPKIGLTFVNGLRSILRQDPDVIMVGEIRDAETAEIAVRSAITGHLVLSTLHTNDAPSTIIRLLDMGIEPYLVASSLVAVIAQRLVRKICPYCKTPDQVARDQMEILGLPHDAVLYRGSGCHVCSGTGYLGRIGIFEIMRLNRSHRELIMTKATADQLRDLSQREGMSTLKEESVRLVLEGITTVAEAIRVTFSE